MAAAADPNPASAREEGSGTPAGGRAAAARARGPGGTAEPPRFPAEVSRKLAQQQPKEEHMIIIAGHSRARNADERDAAVAAFAGMVERARKHDGCLDLSIGADSVDPERINVFECWRDQPSLNAWRKVARAPKVALREARVKLYRTDKAEKPF